jgi:Cys-rich repeat protein
MVGRVLIACLALTAGCEKRSKLYCSKNPDDLANCEQTDAPPPDLVSCTLDSQCPTGHCEPIANVCVQCLLDTHCDAGERCDIGGTYTCRGCISEMDCPTGTCLPSGSCGDDSLVVYVDEAGTDNPDCTRAAPCATLAHGLTVVTATREFLRLTGDHTASPMLLVNKPVQILADGATLTGSTGDVVLKIDGVVAVYGLTIICNGDQDGIESGGGSSTTLEGVDVSGCDHEAGIDLKDGVHKIAHSNIHDNPAGGIRSDGKARLHITNNFVHHNGGLTGFGGISVGADMVRPEQVEFNTVVANDPTGVTCAKAIALVNNVIAGNGLLGAANNSGMCVVSESLVTENIAPLAFKSTAAPFDYHINETSIAKDNAPVPSPVSDDYDGDIRPQDVAKDYGADEYRAP